MKTYNLYSKFFDIFSILLDDSKSDMVKVRNFIGEYWKHIENIKETKIFFDFLHSQYSNNLDIFAMFHTIVNQNDEFRDFILSLLFSMNYDEQGMNLDSLLSIKFIGNDFYIRAVENYNINHSVADTALMSISSHDQYISPHHKYLYGIVKNDNYTEIMQTNVYSGFRNYNNCYKSIYLENTIDYNVYTVVGANDSNIRLGKTNIITSKDKNLFLLYGKDKFNSVYNSLTLNYLGVPECL